MKTKGNWVIRTSAGGFWCGNSHFDAQLRKAQIYHWKEAAEEQVEVIRKRGYLTADIKFEVVAISEPRLVRDTETYWISETDELGNVHDIFCAACMYSALNDYRGNPVKSKFCPKCGKFMINNDQSED